MTFFKGVAIVTTSILLSVGLMEAGKIISAERKARRADRIVQAEMDSAARSIKAKTEHALKTVQAGLVSIQRYDRWTGFRVPIHNSGATPMREVSVSLAMKDSSGKLIGFTTAEIELIEPGKTIEGSASEDVTGIGSASISGITWPEGRIFHNEGPGIPRMQ
jgi:hypothetical protein